MNPYNVCELAAVGVPQPMAWPAEPGGQIGPKPLRRGGHGRLNPGPAGNCTAWPMSDGGSE